MFEILSQYPELTQFETDADAVRARIDAFMDDMKAMGVECTLAVISKRSEGEETWTVGCHPPTEHVPNPSIIAAASYFQMGMQEQAPITEHIFRQVAISQMDDPISQVIELIEQLERGEITQDELEEMMTKLEEQQDGTVDA